MNEPRVSAVCLTYNRPRFLEMAVACFLSQTYPNKEMIIVDTSERPVPIKQPGVIHITYTRRMPLPEAYKFGFRMANGQLLAIWDDDDWSGPRRMEASVQAIESGADAVGTSPLIVEVPTPGFYRWNESVIKEWHDAGGAWLPFGDNTVVFKRNLVDGKPAALMVDLLRQAFLEGAKLRQFPNDGHFAYVRHPKVEWRFKTADICTPVARPEWVTDDMVRFWQQPELVKA